MTTRRSEREIRFVLDGREVAVLVDPDEPLLHVLRDRLAATGPQFGCGAEACGACKVLVGGDARISCRLPVGEVEGSRVTTIAGLAEEGELHPVQRAFLEEQAFQCGYCINGMIIEAAALVMRQRPDDERIRAALDENLCRCGTHVRILRAVHRAAAEIWGP